MSLVEHGLDELIVRKLALPAGKPDLDGWRELVRRIRNPEREISIAVVGKYAEHKDAYKSIYEALDHGGIAKRPRSAFSESTVKPWSTMGRSGCSDVTACWSPAVSASGGSKARSMPFASPARGAFPFRHLPGDAMRSDRVRPGHGQPRRRPLDRVRQRQPPPCDLPAGRTEDDHRQGRHNAVRGPPAKLAAASRAASATRRPNPSDTGTATSSTTPIVRNSSKGAWSFPAPAPTAPWWRSLRSPAIPGSWACSSSRVQVAALPASPTVRRIRRRRRRAAPARTSRRRKWRESGG